MLKFSLMVLSTLSPHIIALYTTRVPKKCDYSVSLLTLTYMNRFS